MPAPDAPAEPGLHPLRVPACPSWDAEPAYPAAGALPDGAVSIRVCPGEKSALGRPLWKPAVSPPVDALTTGTQDVVDTLNALPDWDGLPEDTFCSQEGRPKVHYVIGYADGTTRSVTYGYGECHLLELGPPGDFPTEKTVAKADAAPFMDAVSRGIVEQRRGIPPPGGVPPAPRCVPNARPYTTLPIQELQLAVAALCVLDGEDWRRAVLPRALVERLTVEYAAAETSGRDCSSDWSGKVLGKVVGWSSWGDPIELQLWDECVALGSPWLGGGAFWTMSPQLADALLELELGPPVEQR